MFTVLALLAVGQGSWDTNPAFEKKVSLRWEAVPVEKALQSLKDQVGVPVSASPEVAQDRIILLTKDRPAKEVMRQIATHFKWEWRVVEGRTELYQTPLQKKQAQAAEQDQVLGPYREWREKSREALKLKPRADEVASLNKLFGDNQDLNERYEAEYINGNPDSKRKWLSDYASVTNKIHNSAIRLSPSWRMLHSAIANLTDPQLMELESGLPLVIASNPTKLQIPLGPEGKRYATEMVAEILRTSSMNAKDEFAITRNRALGISEREPFNPADVTNVRVYLRRGNFALRGHSKLYLEAPVISIVGANRKMFAQETLWDQRQPEGPKETLVPSIKDLLDQPIKLTDALKKSLENVGSFARATIVAEQTFANTNSPTFHSEGFAKIACMTADLVGVDLISHCYDGNGVGRASVRDASTGRLLLNALTNSCGMKTELNGDWIQLTDLTPELSRSSTVPSNKLLAARDATLQDFSLDLASKVAGTLSLRQLQSAIVSTLFERKWSLNLRDDRDCSNVLLLWNSLSATQKQVLKNKVELSADTLTNEQKSYYLRQVRMQLMPVLSDIQYIEAADKSWFQDWWRSTGEESLDEDTEVTEQIRDGLNSQSTVSVRYYEGTAVSHQTEGKGELLVPLRTAVKMNLFRPPLSDSRTFRIGSQADLFILFKPTPTVRKGLGVQGMGVSGRSYKVEELPKKTLDEIERLQADGS